MGNIHSGTMAGKLNGVMPAQTPTGWRSEWVSIDGPDVPAELAFQVMRDAAGELDDLQPALHLAQRVGMGLAVLGRDGAGDPLGILLDEALEAHHEARALQGRRVGPAGQRGLRRLDGGVQLIARGELQLARLLACRGVEDRCGARRGGGGEAAADGVADGVLRGMVDVHGVSNTGWRKAADRKGTFAATFLLPSREKVSAGG